MRVCLFIQMITTTHADFQSWDPIYLDLISISICFCAAPQTGLLCSMLIMTTVCQYQEAVTASSTCVQDICFYAVLHNAVRDSQVVSGL